MMELTFLGTASAYPTPSRGVSCIVFRNDGIHWMFDCGEGSQIQLMKSAVRPGKISKIFISHLHGDHVFGLPGLMCTISQNYSPENKEPLVIYGPLGLRKYIRVSLELSRAQLAFDYIVHELVPCAQQYSEELLSWEVDHTSESPLHPNERPGQQIEQDAHGVWNILAEEKHAVRAGWLQHRVPSFGFVIQEQPQPGKIDARKLTSLGVPPGPLYAKIKAGESVTAPNGQVISPTDVLGSERPGRLVAILGDTCNSSQMTSLCQGSDVIVHEATLSDDMKERAIEKGHSTPEMAATFAASVETECLVLTHFSQRYRSSSTQSGQDDNQGDNLVSSLVEEARKVYGGKIVAGEDLLVLPIPARK